MAKSPRFRSLWSSRKFAERVAGLFVDEAHCVHEWGDEFRLVYQELASLRVYAGYDVPMIACSATLPTETFNVVWEKLGYGHRPFFGVDAGTDRSNLLYLVRPVEHPDDPARDVLNMIPSNLTSSSTPDDLRFKAIFYIQNEAACRKAKDTIRRCLPSQLQNLVYNFSSSLSEKAKQALWDRFKRGENKISFSTDAAGMGCNVPDIDLVVVAGDPNTVSAALPPEPSQVEIRDAPAKTGGKGAHKGRSKTGGGVGKAKGKGAGIPKANTLAETNRLKMQPALEVLANMTCPRLDSYSTLTLNTDAQTTAGWRSRGMAFASSWHVLELHGRAPPQDRCCHLCNPELLENWKAPLANDERLTRFASNFVFTAKGRDSKGSLPSTTSTPIGLVNGYYPAQCTPADEEELIVRLDRWRQKWDEEWGGPYSTPLMVLTDRQSQGIAKAGRAFCRADKIDVALVRSVVVWDTASDLMVKGVVKVVRDWVKDVAGRGQPPSAGGREKKKRKANPKHRNASPSSSTTTSPFPSPSKPKGTRKPLQSLSVNQPRLTKCTTASTPVRQPFTGAPDRARPNYTARLRNRGPPRDRATTPPTQPHAPQQADLFSPGYPRSTGKDLPQEDSQATLVADSQPTSDSQAAATETQIPTTAAITKPPLRTSSSTQTGKPGFQACQPTSGSNLDWSPYPYHAVYNPTGVPVANAALYWRQQEIYWQRFRTHSAPHNNI
ncbi:hypothetical protein FRB90_004557 [Tulasnella sp. 427]|nr:hypothetical protein FRB90_004557 [Tulasnella sp. 427]